jgi:hypothetical protein
MVGIADEADHTAKARSEVFVFRTDAGERDLVFHGSNITRLELEVNWFSEVEPRKIPVVAAKRS